MCITIHTDTLPLAFIRTFHFSFVTRARTHQNGTDWMSCGLTLALDPLEKLMPHRNPIYGFNLRHKFVSHFHALLQHSMHVNGPRFRFYLFYLVHFLFSFFLYIFLHISNEFECLKVLIQHFHLFVRPKMKWSIHNEMIIFVGCRCCCWFSFFWGKLLNGIIVFGQVAFHTNERNNRWSQKWQIIKIVLKKLQHRNTCFN